MDVCHVCLSFFLDLSVLFSTFVVNKRILIILDTDVGRRINSNSSKYEIAV